MIVTNKSFLKNDFKIILTIIFDNIFLCYNEILDK